MGWILSLYSGIGIASPSFCLYSLDSLAESWAAAFTPLVPTQTEYSSMARSGFKWGQPLGWPLLFLPQSPAQIGLPVDLTPPSPLPHPCSHLCESQGVILDTVALQPPWQFCVRRQVVPLS